ncbi:hypothetical protein RRG08_038048 [Elysia crispata]|uniref:Uncharacterized protein n=1 Tax=Elysia crispata TaxID=231223 RepID=A0AAE0ZYU2_9GAST|nr:hypothetical protein RRG08_038048 [Elysia crispata]
MTANVSPPLFMNPFYFSDDVAASAENPQVSHDGQAARGKGVKRTHCIIRPSQRLLEHLSIPIAAPRLAASYPDGGKNRLQAVRLPSEHKHVMHRTQINSYFQPPNSSRPDAQFGCNCHALASLVASSQVSHSSATDPNLYSRTH